MREENNMGLKEVARIEDLNYGAAAEQFERAFNEVIRNVMDPATEAKKKREIILSVTVVPTEDRNMAATKVEVKTKLAPVKPDVGSLMFDLDDHGKFIAKAYEAEDQGELFYDDNKKKEAK